ncbi:hypothetical protein MRX96_046258 [Rhipicephalus microplus]
MHWISRSRRTCHEKLSLENPEKVGCYGAILSRLLLLGRKEASRKRAGFGLAVAGAASERRPGVTTVDLPRLFAALYRLVTPVTDGARDVTYEVTATA